jgi:hypothetical protein
VPKIYAISFLLDEMHDPQEEEDESDLDGNRADSLELVHRPLIAQSQRRILRSRA